MGICATKGEVTNKEENEKSKELDRNLAQEQQSGNQVFKLLLLGTGDSGKSTIFKQMTILYGKGFSEEERRYLTQTVYANVITQMQELCRQKDLLCKDIEMSPEEIEARKSNDELSADTDVVPENSAGIATLWKSKAIQETYEKRAQFQMNTSAGWFFERLSEIAAVDYIPSAEDMLRTRVPTTGMHEREFVVAGSTFSMIDVGGQRSERKKWIHLFENVTAVLFVAAMSEYDECLFEEEQCNRLVESLKLWEEISNLVWFEETSMILFLNKSDLFREKIMKSPLAQDQEKFPKYPDCKVKEQDYEEGANWIQEQFHELVKNEKMIYVHFTIATDSKNVFAVFNDVKDIVIKNSLSRAGFNNMQ